MSRCTHCGADNPDSLKFCGECGTRLPAATAIREVRKTVTVLFADVEGSTALGERLDPESLRALMTRYFAEIRAVIERHGGTVEKFIGDAVMAVFGIPVLHEDDALRAVRAASEIRERLDRLNEELLRTRGLTISFRTGLHTGEVVAGDSAVGETLVTGDTVNTAARLEQAAGAGEILLGRTTYNLVRDAVSAEAVEPISAKGKAEPVPAYRLILVTAGAEGHARRADAPLVGRARELEQLQHVFERAVEERSPQLFTLLGTAGVGKSRLVAEFLASLKDRATVLKGRCLPYGEGITYWPLREIVHGAAGIEENDSTDEAKARLRLLFEGEPQQDLLTRRVAGAIGLESETAPQEDIFWATRKLLEQLARQRPLVALIEDIHWADPTFLDLLEYIVDLGTDAPLLLLCPARPEMLESRAGWGGSRAHSTMLRLEPLGGDATEQLIESLPGGNALPPPLRDRILVAAEGNPLYLEEMLAMLVDEGLLVEHDGEWLTRGDLEQFQVPPSVRALLAARIDALPKEERRVAERASVVGRVFEAAAVRELAPPGGESEIGRSLLALVRKELIRPERSELSAGDAFKFRHLLIRDAAYEALPKSERAELHERFADWLERAAGDRLTEYEEILGYHYEQAHRYRSELGETGERVDRLAARGAGLLAQTGERAFRRDDTAAAATLLARANKLAVGDAVRARVGYQLAGSLFQTRRFRESIDVANDAIASAERAHEDAAAAHARLWLFGARQVLGEVEFRDIWPSIAEVRSTFERLGDRAGLARVELNSSFLYSAEGKEAESINASRRAAEHAMAANDPRVAAAAVAFVADSYMFGIANVHAVLDEVEGDLSRTRAIPSSFYTAAGALAGLHAMAGNFERASDLLAERRAVARERGSTRELSNRWVDGYVALLADEPARVIESVGDAYATARDAADRVSAPLQGAALADAWLRLGEAEKARGIVGELRAMILADDASGAAMVAMVAALLAEHDHDHVAANKLAREAIDLVDKTEWLDIRATSWLILAEVASSEDPPTSETAGRQALALFEQKGNVVSAARARKLLDELAAREGATP